MYDDIDLKHVARINFWSGVASGFVAALAIFYLIGISN